MNGEPRSGNGSRVNLSVLTGALAGVLAAALVSLAAQPAAAESLTDEQALVEKARLTLNDFLSNQNMSWLHDHLKDAKGVYIVPQFLKAAFFLGGAGGNGILLVRDDKTGEWSDPAFYTLASGSFGLQIGAEASEVVMLVMTEKGVKSLLSTTLKLGPDASIAVGPLGAGIAGQTAINLSADLLSFARSRGLFGGVSFEGAVVAAESERNKSYYGKEVSPEDILVKRTVSNSSSGELRALLAKASRNQ